MKRIFIILLFGLIASLVATDSMAIDFILRDDQGVYHYNCVNNCGPVRIKKSGKCEYLVLSTYYSGKVKACYPEKAALQACGEIKMEVPVKKELLNPACL